MKHVSTKTDRDRAVVMEVVRRFGPLSRVDIQKLTRLRPTTVSELVRHLLQERRLREVGRRSGKPLGRKQVLLQVDPEYGLVLGLEFDSEAVVAAVLDLEPSVRALVRERARLEEGQPGLVEQMLACSRRALSEAGLERRKLLGIGVSDPGLIDSRHGISLICSTLEFWKDVPLKRIFEDSLGAPCLLESNARARTLAERLRGAGAMSENMVYVDYGAGIGAGIVSQGTLLRGWLESAGEFGHTHVMQDGPPCRCGSFGCLEAVAGAPALAARARKAIQEGSGSEILALAGGQAGAITGWHVLEAASRADKLALALVEDLGERLGLGIANLVNLLNPELVVLDRRLEMAGSALLEQIVRVVKRQALRRCSDRLTFRYGEFREEGGVLGAALMVVDELFEIPALKPPRYLIDPHALGTVEK